MKACAADGCYNHVTPHRSSHPSWVISLFPLKSHSFFFSWDTDELQAYTLRYAARTVSSLAEPKRFNSPYAKKDHCKSVRFHARRKRGNSSKFSIFLREGGDPEKHSTRLSESRPCGHSCGSQFSVEMEEEGGGSVSADNGNDGRYRLQPRGIKDQHFTNPKSVKSYKSFFTAWSWRGFFPPISCCVLFWRWKLHYATCSPCLFWWGHVLQLPLSASKTKIIKALVNRPQNLQQNFPNNLCNH